MSIGKNYKAIRGAKRHIVETAMTTTKPTSDGEKVGNSDPGPASKKRRRRRKKPHAAAGDVENIVSNLSTVRLKSPKKPDVSLSSRFSTGSDNWDAFQKLTGVKPRRGPSPSRKTPKITRCVALDCEFVGVGDDGRDNMLGRVSIVNSMGECVYDTFVKPREKVVDYRTFVSGVRPKDMASGQDFEKVQNNVAGILKGRILIGHALKNDLEVLKLSHPRHSIRDTSMYFRERGRTPSLKQLASEFLNFVIQEGEHSSVQDAIAAMQLYNMYKKEWEAGGGNKKSNRIKRKLICNDRST